MGIPRAKNSCYTYFRIVGQFEPDDATVIFQLIPSSQRKMGDKRRNGTRYEFASWEYGRCDDYDVFIENQMMKTIGDLISKVELLRQFKQKHEVEYVLEIVPSIYMGESNPCLAPSREVIKFCYETDTQIDIDL